MYWLYCLAVVMILLCAADAVGQKQQTSDSARGLFGDLPLDDPASNSVLRSGEHPAEKIRSNIFVRATVSKPGCYLGEPILVTYKLYTALKSTSKIRAKPALSSFSSSDLDTKNGSDVLELVGKRRFRVFTIWKVQLCPYKDGELVLDPMIVDNSVSYTGADGKSYSYEGPVKSNPLPITVKTLPTLDRPKAYSGAVGQFDLQVSIDKSDVKVGENNMLRLEVDGFGSQDNLQIPSVNWPPDFDHFLIKESRSTDEETFPPRVRKIFEVPFVSKKRGEFTIEPVKLSFFNPASGNYETVSSSALKLHVASSGTSAIKANMDPSGKSAESANALRVQRRFIIGSLLVGFCVLILIVGKFIRGGRRDAEPVSKISASLNGDPNALDIQSELGKISSVSSPLEFGQSARNLLTKMLQERIPTDAFIEEDLMKAFSKSEIADQKILGMIGETFKLCSRLVFAPAQEQDTRVRITELLNLVAIGTEVQRST